MLFQDLNKHKHFPESKIIIFSFFFFSFLISKFFEYFSSQISCVFYVDNLSIDKLKGKGQGAGIKLMVSSCKEKQ